MVECIMNFFDAKKKSKIRYMFWFKLSMFIDDDKYRTTDMRNSRRKKDSTIVEEQMLDIGTTSGKRVVRLDNKKNYLNK